MIGLIPGLGDMVDAGEPDYTNIPADCSSCLIGLNYGLIVRPASKLDIPKDLFAKMLVNNAVCFIHTSIPE